MRSLQCSRAPRPNCAPRSRRCRRRGLLRRRPRQRRRRRRPADPSFAVDGDDRRRASSGLSTFRSSVRQVKRTGESAPVHGRGLRVLLPDRLLWARRIAVQRRHARRDAARAPRRAPSPMPSSPASVSTDYQMVNLKLVDVILEALSQFRPYRGRSPMPVHRVALRPIAWRNVRWPGHSVGSIRDHRFGLRRRHGPRRHLGNGDAPEQSARHADRNPRIRVSVPDQRASSWCRTAAAPAAGAAA